MVSSVDALGHPCTLTDHGSMDDGSPVSVKLIAYGPLGQLEVLPPPEGMVNVDTPSFVKLSVAVNWYELTGVAVGMMNVQVKVPLLLVVPEQAVPPPHEIVIDDDGPNPVAT
jgi:hypothetical protein